MKVFNLTDVETPALKQRQVVGQTIAVGDKLLGPGQSGDIDDETLERTRVELQDMVTYGMVALGEPPADYLNAQAAAKAAAKVPDPLPQPATPPATEDAAPAADPTPSPPARRR